LFRNFQHCLANLTKVETNKTNLQKTEKKVKVSSSQNGLAMFNSHKQLSIFELHNTILKQNKNLKKNQMSIKV
jgi:hypothetical protein